MKQTDADLQRYYNTANRLYFRNALPNDLPIVFDRLRPKVLGSTATRGAIAHGIRISIRLRPFLCLTVMTVLHEMLHVEKPLHCGHDWRFDKRMLRLAKAGAFDGLW